MTRKDFELVAEVLNKYNRTHLYKDISIEIAIDLANGFEQAYERFDKTRFIKAVKK